MRARQASCRRTWTPRMRPSACGCCSTGFASSSSPLPGGPRPGGRWGYWTTISPRSPPRQAKSWAQAVVAASHRSSVDLIIGTYTERLPHVHGQSDGILGGRFDPASGRIGPGATLAGARTPSCLAVSASGGSLYGVEETETFDGQPGGGITAYTRDPRTGQLTWLN